MKKLCGITFPKGFKAAMKAGIKRWQGRSRVVCSTVEAVWVAVLPQLSSGSAVLCRDLHWKGVSGAGSDPERRMLQRLYGDQGLTIEKILQNNLLHYRYYRGIVVASKGDGVIAVEKMSRSFVGRGDYRLWRRKSI